MSNITVKGIGFDDKKEQFLIQNIYFYKPESIHFRYWTKRENESELLKKLEDLDENTRNCKVVFYGLGYLILERDFK